MTKLDCTVTTCVHNAEKCCCKNTILVEGAQAFHQRAAVLHERIDRNDRLVILIDQFITHDRTRLFLLIHDRFFQIRKWDHFFPSDHRIHPDRLSIDRSLP